MRRSIFAYIIALSVAYLPLGNVYADDKDSIIESLLVAESGDDCRATYSVDDQTLAIPCLEVSGESVSYAIKMQQVTEKEPRSFAVIQVQENVGKTGDSCRAEYDVLKGQLSVPCVSVENGTNGKVYTLELNFSKESNLFVVVENNPITTRQSWRSCPTSAQYDRKTNGVSFTDYGYANPLGNFINLYVAQPFFSKHYFTGKVHLGIDYMISAGQSVYAICDGTITNETQDFTYQETVRERGNYSAYFNSRMILDCGSFLAIYGHVDKVASGRVDKGQKIAVIAPAYYNDNVTLDKKNDHLHFGITTASKAILGTISGITWGFGIASPASKVNYNLAVSKGYQDAINYLCKNRATPKVHLKLDSSIKVEPNPMVEGKAVKITVKISNRDGTKDFKGNLFAAFHPKGNPDENWFEIKLENQPLPAGNDYTYTFGKHKVTLSPNEYDLYIKGDDFRAIEAPGYYQNPITVTVVEGTSSSKGSVFHGAGSLIEPTTNCYGCNKDLAYMHPTDINSTVVFQWKNIDSGECRYLDIKENSGSLAAVISTKTWSARNVQKAYKVTEFPVTIPNVGGWNTTAITSISPLSEAVEVAAYCRTNNNNLGSKETVSTKDVTFANGYIWAGNGSIISKDSSGNSYGNVKDEAVTHKDKPSLTAFQWQVSDRCKKLKLYGDKPFYGRLKIKPWSGSSYTTNEEVKFPQYITRDSGYFVIAIETEKGAVYGSKISAQCQ